MSKTYVNLFLPSRLVSQCKQCLCLCSGPGPEGDAASTTGRTSEGFGPNRVWGAVVNFERVGKKDQTDSGDGESHKKRKEGPYIVDVLVNCASDTIPGTGPKR